MWLMISLLRKICSTDDRYLPSLVTKSNYCKIVKRPITASKNVAEQTMSDASDEVRGNAPPDNN